VLRESERAELLSCVTGAEVRSFADHEFLETQKAEKAGSQFSSRLEVLG
jgi:hypothetical protein